MKLSPPASSSDLEVARDIAQRLHQRRRREDLSSGAPIPTTPALRPLPPPPFPPVPSPAALPFAPSSAPAPAFPASPPPVPAFPASSPLAPPSPPPRARALRSDESPEPPPSWDESVGEAAGPTPEPVDVLPDFGEPTPPAEPVEAMDVPLPDVEMEGPDVSPEELVGAPGPPPVEELPELEDQTDPHSPFDVGLDDASAEELFEAPPAPSWDDIVATCLGLAQARGAMLVDRAGQVFAAHGQWPEPGPEAIATKLVTTMDRTLKDAPTRSISAPLMGKHLTAWRVPLAEGLVTIAFIGESPVRAETRPAIDTEIHRGAGA